jgi:hypothetical protein
MESTITDNSIETVLAQCYRSLAVFDKTFLPAAFDKSFSRLHYEILSALDSPHQKIAIAAPRGLGKTTIAKSLVMRSILFRDYEFIPYVSNSESVALMQTENIKRELRSNSEIRKFFGDIAINTDDPGIDESFSKHAWVAFGNTLVLPRGYGQQIRGLLFKNHRPQLIIVDDLERREDLANPETRTKIKEWFFADLVKCIDQYSRKWRIIYIDTLKHSESLLQTLLDAPDWKSIRLELCDDEYNSNVPEFMSTEELRAEAEAHRAKGMLSVFYMEYRNIISAKEDMAFSPDYFRYYDEETLDRKELENVIIVDPAKTANLHSADSAIVGIGINYRTGSIYIRDIVSGKFHPNELYDEMFAMRSRLSAHVIGVEVTGLEEFIRQPIENEMQRRGPSATAELIWLKARGGSPEGEKGKLRRIGMLVPYYRQGFIYHNRNCCTKLESQLLKFTTSGLVDVADAVSYIIEMLDLGNRYFTSPEENLDDVESEYENIEYDDPLDEFEYVRI